MTGIPRGDRHHGRACTLVYGGIIAYAVHQVVFRYPHHEHPEKSPVYGTEDLLISLCNSVTRVLGVATHSQIHYSGMVQRISKTCLKPDIGCFVLFDGGFWGW